MLLMLSLFSWTSFELINMTGRLEDFYIDVSNSSDGASALDTMLLDPYNCVRCRFKGVR